MFTEFSQLKTHILSINGISVNVSRFLHYLDSLILYILKLRHCYSGVTLFRIFYTYVD